MAFSNYKNYKKHIDNTFPKKITLISKNKIKGKSKCAICWNWRQIWYRKWIVIFPQFFNGRCYKGNMETYCAKWRRNTKNLNSKIFKLKNRRLIMELKCADCGIKKSRFVKEQESKGLWSNLGIKIPLSKISLLDVLF